MSQFDIRVQRELYAQAPEGIAVYAQNPSYASTHANTLVESYKHETFLDNAKGDRIFFHPRILRRISYDNGVTWHAEPDHSNEHPESLAGTRRNVSLHTLDTARNILIAFHCTYDVDPTQDMFAKSNIRMRTYRPWYQLSFDAAKSWTPLKPVIDERPGHDLTHWAPGMTHGISGASNDLSTPVWLQDGSVVFGMTLTNVLPLEERRANPDKPGRHAVGYLRARFNADGTDLLWQMGDPIILTPQQSPRGACEPATACLGGTRLFNVMRCQGDQATGVYSTRYSNTSEDGGATWSTPQPLLYDDGQPVWTPASLSSFIRSSKSGHWYWLANILPGPVYAQTPRHPLSIARFDPQSCRILRNSVRVIQALPPGMHEEVRYTNWGMYQDRLTGELVLTLPEQPKYMNFSAITRPEQFTADCYRYRVRLPE
jgi:hypothetical protein